MAEAIGVATGLVSLAAFAGQCSLALYDTLASYHSHQQRVRDLVDEASALADVLRSLADTARADPDLQWPALAIPLKRCARACQEFEQEIKKFSSRSTDKRTSFRDWAKLRYMGEDVDGFRRLLSEYKMTITVALTDVSIRKSLVTAEAMEGYDELLKTTKASLEGRLEMIDDKLDLMLSHNVTRSQAEADDVSQIKEERRSTEYCLQICAQLSEHISQIQLVHTQASSSSGEGENAKPSSTSEEITNEGLQECRNSLARMAARLASHEKQLFNRLADKMRATNNSSAAADDVTRLRDEWESAYQSMELLSSAANQLERSVSVIENHATGDAVQFMVSTKGKVLRGTNRGLGWRTRQFGGYLDDETVRQLSRDMNRVSLRSGDEAQHSARSPRSEDVPKITRHEEFSERFGEGYKLTSSSVAQVRAPATSAHERRSKSS